MAQKHNPIPKSAKMMIDFNINHEKKKRRGKLLVNLWSGIGISIKVLIGLIGFSIMAFLAFLALDDKIQKMVLSWFTF